VCALKDQRRALVISEVALAFLLLAGAGLMLQAFARVRALDPGFRAENVLTARTLLPSPFSSLCGSDSDAPQRKQSVTHLGITASERIAWPALSLRQKPIASAL